MLESEKELYDALKKFDENYNPKVLYILVNKNNITRFFQITQKPEKNPVEGTVV